MSLRCHGSKLHRSSPFTLGTMTSRITRSGGSISMIRRASFAVSGLNRLHPLVLEIADDDVPDNVLVVHHENARPLGYRHGGEIVLGAGRTMWTWKLPA